MNYFELTIKDEVYKLRLNTRSAVALEKALNCNPLDIILKMDGGAMPKLTEVVIIFQAMLQQYQHGFTLDKTYDLFDDYVAGGKTMFDFVSEVMIPVFQNSGFLNTETANDTEEVKN